MSYRGMGEATTAGAIPDAWTRRRAAAFNAAMARSGVGAVIPGFSRPIAVPGLDVATRAAVSARVPIHAPGLDTLSRIPIHAPGLDTSQARRLDTTRLKPPFGTVDPASVEPPPVGPAPIAMMIGWGAAVAIAAGIFWAVTRPGSTTANRRRSRKSSRRRSRRSSRLRSNRRRSRRNPGEVVVRYGQSVDHRTPFYENWYSDGSRGKLTSVSDVTAAKHEADRIVATLKKRGFNARARKESLSYAANPRKKRSRKRSLRLPTKAEVKKANAGSVAKRRALARRYGLSGFAAACVGLKSASPRRRRRK